MTKLGNTILSETIDMVSSILGSKMNTLTVERAVLGLFFSGVRLSSGEGGLCATPVKEIPEAVCCPSSAKAMPLSGKLRGRSVITYLEDIFSDNILKKTLGIAVLNALSASCWRECPPTEYEIVTGVDAFNEIEIPSFGKRTVVVGALAPILKKLRAAEANFTVLEMDARTLKPYELQHYAPATDAEKYIPCADLLVITGTTLLNNTLPSLLAMAKPGAEILITGPTASTLPNAFFRQGVTIMGGVIVTKPDEALDIISEGGSGYHFFGKSVERLIIRRSLRTATA